MKTSHELLSDIDNLETERRYVIEGLLKEKQVLLLSAEPGVGKSVVLLQAALSIASGTPLFGEFQVPKPLKVALLLLEGTYEETIERIRAMKEEIPIIAENLGIIERPYFEASNTQQKESLIKEVESIFVPDFFATDPLYMITGHDLASEKGSKYIIQFMREIRDRWKCVEWLNHHTHRKRYQDGKEVEEDDPYFGSQWLKGFVDISYTMKASKDHRSVILYSKKDRSKSAPKEIILHYDPETMTCSTDFDPKTASGEERVLNFYKSVKSSNRTTNFYEVMEAAQVSHAHLRRIQMRHLRMGVIKCDKRSGKKRIWEIL